MNFSQIASAMVVTSLCSIVTFSSGVQDKKDEPPAIPYSQAPLKELLPQGGCSDKPLPLSPLEAPKIIRVSSSMMSKYLVHQEIPVYPKKAKDKHIEGTVAHGTGTERELQGASLLRHSSNDARPEIYTSPVQ